jgi:acetyltransferase-like isoleucine patch superfamily enzyme
MKNIFSQMVRNIELMVICLLKCFYKYIDGANPFYIAATVFFPQKILRINGAVPWPVDFRSKILYHKRIKLGVRSFPGWSPGCYIQARNGIEIGSNLRMGPGVGLISANHDVDDYDRWASCSPLKIGNNVWIGMNAVVLPGIIIGDNVAIGANSVVNKNIPSNSIAAGNPCRVVREKIPYQGEDYNQLSF